MAAIVPTVKSTGTSPTAEMNDSCRYLALSMSTMGMDHSASSIRTSALWVIESMIQIKLAHCDLAYIYIYLLLI